MAGKYEPLRHHFGPLRHHLESLHDSMWRAGFAEIEQILGCTLPSSARLYPAWWSNDASQGRHSLSWTGMGWRTESVNLMGEEVTFVRSSIQSRPRPAASPPRPDAALDQAATNVASAPWPWDQASRFDCCLRLEWAPLGRVLLDAVGKLVFPTPPRKPGLYRFRIRAANAEERYVGEADDLRRRFQRYRTPGPTQATNIRLNRHFSHALSHRAEISVAIVIDGAWIKRDENLEQANLSLKAMRRLFESLALVAENDTLIASLNR